jgi:hypothetical protein
VKKEWVKLLDENSLRLCDKGFVDSFFKELESDLIYSAKLADGDVYFYVLTELQSSVDFKMPFRVFQYIWAIHMREWMDTPEEVRSRADFRLTPVIPIVFYNGTENWSAIRSFKDYQKRGEMYEGITDFEYILVDTNHLDKEYLLKNHDAICAAIAVDKVRSGEFEQFFNTLMAIVHAKAGFDQAEFKDFLEWLKHTLAHRTGSEEDANRVIKLIEEGDEAVVRTGVDILFDEAEARGVINAAVRMIKKGMGVREIADILDLSDEQLEQAEIKAGLKKEFA